MLMVYMMVVIIIFMLLHSFVWTYKFKSPFSGSHVFNLCWRSERLNDQTNQFFTLTRHHFIQSSFSSSSDMTCCFYVHVLILTGGIFIMFITVINPWKPCFYQMSSVTSSRHQIHTFILKKKQLTGNQSTECEALTWKLQGFPSTAILYKSWHHILWCHIL